MTSIRSRACLPRRSAPRRPRGRPRRRSPAPSPAYWRRASAVCSDLPGDDEAGGDSRVQAPRAVLAVRGARRGEARGRRGHRRTGLLRQHGPPAGAPAVPGAAKDGQGLRGWDDSVFDHQRVSRAAGGGVLGRRRRRRGVTAAAADGSPRRRPVGVLPRPSAVDAAQGWRQLCGEAGFNAEGSKALTSAAATVLESFHEFEDEAEGRRPRPVHAYPPRRRRHASRRYPPPPGETHRVEDKEGKGGTVRPPLSAVVSLLRLLPSRTDADIGRAGKIANCLGSRAQGVRTARAPRLPPPQKARKTLPQVVQPSNRLTEVS